MVTLDQAGAGRSITRLLPPSDRTKDWIEHFCVVDQRAQPMVSGRWRIVPDMCPHLIAVWGGAGVRAIVVGARSVFADRPAGGRLATVGIRFRPGTLPRLTGVPADDLTDQSVPIEAVWGAAGRDLICRLGRLDPLLDAPAVLESFVFGIAHDAEAIDWRAAAVRAAVSRDPGVVRVGALAHDLGVSERSMRDVSRRWLGLSPKRLARIERLFGALDRALPRQAGGAPSWSRVAVDSGYSDQPHLIREFGALLGEAPGAFVARAAETFNRALP